MTVRVDTIDFKHQVPQWAEAQIRTIQVFDGNAGIYTLVRSAWPDSCHVIYEDGSDESQESIVCSLQQIAEGFGNDIAVKLGYVPAK